MRGTITRISRETGVAEDFHLNVMKNGQGRIIGNPEGSDVMTKWGQRVVAGNKVILRPKNIRDNPLNSYRDYVKN